VGKVKQVFSKFRTGTNFSVIFNIPLTKKFFALKMFVAKRPEAEASGWTSRCKDGQHVLFFDFDGLSFDEMCDEIIHFLQPYFDLSTFYIFNSVKSNVAESRNFHAICLDKFSLPDAVEIVSNSSCDKGFQKAPYLFRRKRWVLRQTGKGERLAPKFILKIVRENNRFKSNAHRLVLENLHGVAIEKNKYFDDLNELNICSYLTGNRVAESD
jgi:hypothetical protein